MAQIFNQEALNALDSHKEQMEMPRVASPKLWLLLTALLTLCAVAVFWCAFGTVNYTVTARSVIFPFGDARPVSVYYDGTIDKVVVTNGQTVKPGDALVNIRSQLATAVLRAPEAGVVLTALTPNSNFTKREPLVWLLPQATAMHEREVLAYVTFKDLRKVKRGAQVQVTPSDLEREKWGYATGRVVDIAAYPTNRKAVADKLKLAELASFIPEGETVYEVRIVLDSDDDGLIWSRKKSQEVAMTTGMPCQVQIIWSKRYIWQVLLGQAENTLNSIQGK